MTTTTRHLLLTTFSLLLLLPPSARADTAAPGDSDAKTLTILAVNDMHAAIDQFPRFAAIVADARAADTNLLLLSAGDNRTGNPVNDRHETPGLPMVELMNRLRFDATALGNHEFDSGTAGLNALIARADFPHLCANIDAPPALRLHTQPFRFFERNGIRVGVLGLIQTGPAGIPDTHPANVAGITFRPVIHTAKDYRWMRGQCDVLILLTHFGYEDDLKLADAIPEADIIIGAHSHTVVPSRILRNGVLVTQAGRVLKNVTELTLEVSGSRVTAKGYRLIPVDPDGPRDLAIQTLVDSYNSNELFSHVLTTVATPFGHVEELGCLMADAHRAGTQSDIAIVNFGGVRYDTHPAGPFLMKDALMLDPFNNSLITFDMTGADVHQLILSAYAIGENPYVSGITYRVAFNADTTVSDLIVLTPDGQPLPPAKTYRVAINSYLATVCPFTKSRPGTGTNIGATDALIEHMKKQPSISYQGTKRILAN